MVSKVRQNRPIHKLNKYVDMNNYFIFLPEYYLTVSTKNTILHSTASLSMFFYVNMQQTLSLVLTHDTWLKTRGLDIASSWNILYSYLNIILELT